jgi:hypothetical protein
MNIAPDHVGNLVGLGCPIALTIVVVQPGLWKANATHDQLQLLSITENYPLETYRIPIVVIASP